jgi:hypothetical protein
MVDFYKCWPLVCFPYMAGKHETRYRKQKCSFTYLMETCGIHTTHLYFTSMYRKRVSLYKVDTSSESDNKLALIRQMFPSKGRSHFRPGIRSLESHANRTQNSHFKQCISWRLGGLTSSYIVYDYTTT